MRIARLALLLVLACAGAPAQEAGHYRLSVEPLPRNFGLTLGDVVTRHLDLEVPADQALAPGNLPAPGRAGPWLEALPPEMAREGQRYRIQLAYRVINLDPGFPRIRLPALGLELQGGGRVAVPAEPLAVVWLSPPEGPPGRLRPDRPPQPARAPVAGTAMAAGAVALGLGLLGWLHFPLALGSGGPFQRCLGRLRRLGAGPWDESTRRIGLRAIHAALDASAGATLLAADLDGFLERQPRFRPVAADLADLFRVSTEVFYRDRPCPLDRDGMLALARRCRDAERGLLG